MKLFRTSKFIDDIIWKIKNEPKEWQDIGQGISRGKIRISGFGNSKSLSIIDVHINGELMPTTWADLWNLESAVGDWYKTINLTHLVFNQ